MCDFTKITFTKKDAEAVLKKSVKSYNPRRRECRMYYCAECNAWHLTSQEKHQEATVVSLKFKKKWLKLLKNTG